LGRRSFARRSGHTGCAPTPHRSVSGPDAPTYVWLYNEDGGRAYAEAEAMPFPSYGHIVGGWAYLSRTTSNDPCSVSNRGESVYENDGPGWYHYQYLYPICNASGACKNSWVSFGMSGQALLSVGVAAGLGPVITWTTSPTDAVSRSLLRAGPQSLEGVAGQAPLGDRERDRKLAMKGVPMRRILSVAMAAVVLLAMPRRAGRRRRRSVRRPV